VLFGEGHVRRYRGTGGEVGYLWNDVTTPILETTGRHIGKPRAKALIFGQDGDRYVVVASKGGARRHPDWYLNLRDDPKAAVVLERTEPSPEGGGRLPLAGEWRGASLPGWSARFLPAPEVSVGGRRLRSARPMRRRAGGPYAKLR
jgi:F420H(2)-dependent quinone reductase